MTKWTAPDIASIRGDNSRPLQKIFGSLTEYLKDTLSQTTEVSQTYVRNGETTALTVGTVVYLHAQQGDRATVKRAFNTSDATSAKTLGVVAETIAPNSDGLVTTLGYLEKVNTSAFTAGQTLYLGATAGTFTATKPVAPNHMVYVGVVVRANAGNGIIYVRCQNGYELDEIHDVLITSPTAGQTLSYDAVTSLWKNATFSDGGGLTNLNASNLASGTVPTGRMTGAYTGITSVGTLTGLAVSNAVTAATFTGGSTNSANPVVTLNGVSGSGALNLFNDLGAGGYNPIVTAGSKGIIVAGANNTTTKAALAIAPWSSTAYGIRFTGGSTTDILVRGTTTFTSTLAADKALIVQGVASQSGDFFDIQNSGGTSQFKVDSAGNVGIGTSSPASYGLLSVGASISASTTKNMLAMYQSAGVDSATMRIAGYAYTGNARTAIDFVQNGATNFNSQMVFSTSAGADAIERMRIDSAGNVTLTGLLIGKISNVATIAAANDSGSFSVRGNTSFPAVMSFHRIGAYAVNFGLSTANKMELGGWSASTIKHTWDMTTGEFISSGRIHAQTDLRVGNSTSTVLSSTLYNLVVTPQAYTGLPVLIGEHYSLAGVGTTNNDFTVFANATVRIKYINNTIATFNSTGMTINGAGSGVEIRATSQTLINGTNNNAGIYLGGGYASSATGGIEASWRDASNPTIAIGVTRDNNRTMTVHSYVDNTIRFHCGNTVKAYVNGSGFLATHYYGNVQYGYYGSMSVYGVNNGWAGIVFPDATSTMMIGVGAGQEFGHYRNNNTWNFYVTGGTFVPSDARYKRDIEPLEHGMNLIREIVPVTYDPLTENTDDDPEQTVGRTHYGFTTQNILEALTNAGETRDVAIVDVGGCDLSMGSDRQYLNHSALIAPIVKAIQELDTRLQQLETV